MRKYSRTVIEIIKKAVFIFLPLVILSSATIFILYQKDVERDDMLIKRHVTDHIDILQEIITNQLKLISSDLLFLAQQSVEYQEHRASYHSYESMYMAELKYYTIFSRNRKIYDQIRVLDPGGAETLRVSYNQGHPQNVPKSQLHSSPPQDFAIISQLSIGKIYISSTVSNEEHPIKLIVQVSTPLFDNNGEKTGTLMLTCLGEQLFQHLEKIWMEISGGIMLLNADGYWIKRKKLQDVSFARLSDSNPLFSNFFPREWQEISAHRSGQFINTRGLFTFLSIYPNSLIEALQTTPTEENQAYWSESNDRPWKIVSYVPSRLLFVESENFLYKLIIVYIPLIILIGIGSFALAIANRKHYSIKQRSKKEFLSYLRFVPQEFLSLLKKNRFSDVELEDHIQQEMTIFFSDIRSYTKLSESMTPMETFNFLNSYFKQISPPIKKNYGFIDKFIGDAVMAIFPDPESPYNALSSVMALKRQLIIYNQGRIKANYEPIDVGFGLHYGEVTLGTVGSFDRMETTVIGDTVNLASRLESLTKIFKVDIILSDAVYSRLPATHGFHLREIDTVRVKGKDKPVVLYEAFDTNEPIIFEQKRSSLSLFQQALADYKAGHFQEAMTLFGQCQALCPADPLPPIYIKRCNALLRVPPGPDWAGISTL